MHTTESPAQGRMHQTTLNLAGLRATHRDYDGDAMMSTLMKFDDRISTAIASIQAELRDGRDAARIFAAITATAPLARQLGAADLFAVAQSAYANFAGLSDAPGTPLSAEAHADAMVWISVARETRAVTRALFQFCLTQAIAPNGARLDLARPVAASPAEAPAASPFDDENAV